MVEEVCTSRYKMRNLINEYCTISGSITNLPIVIKGVLRADDAELAIQYGASAIAVSNHGGRQLDGVQATVRSTHN